MAIELSTAVRNGQADALGDDFDNGAINFYESGGSPPATADAAAVGTLLASCPIAADGFGSASGGVISITGTPEDSAADATGNADYFRIVSSSDDGTLSTSQKRIQGTVTGPSGGGDIELDSAGAAITQNQVVTVSSLTITQPAS